jgi:CIC family chloride channel protein
LAIVVGLVTGLGAVVFRDLIGLIYNITFLGIFSFDYDASVFTPAPHWGALIILVPVVAGQIVTSSSPNSLRKRAGTACPR